MTKQSLTAQKVSFHQVPDSHLRAVPKLDIADSFLYKRRKSKDASCDKTAQEDEKKEGNE